MSLAHCNSLYRQGPYRARVHRQVGEVDSVFQALRAEVEALFLTGPSVSLEAVSAELQNMHAHVANEVRVTGLSVRSAAKACRLVSPGGCRASEPGFR